MQDDQQLSRDIVFGSLVVKKSFANNREVGKCLEEAKRRRKAGEDVTLADIMVSSGIVEAGQAKELLEFQREKLISCPQCNSIYNTEGLAHGKKIRCKKCENIITVSRESSDDPPPSGPPLQSVKKSKSSGVELEEEIEVDLSDEEEEESSEQVLPSSRGGSSQLDLSKEFEEEIEIDVDEDDEDEVADFTLDSDPEATAAFEAVSPQVEEKTEDIEEDIEEVEQVETDIFPSPGAESSPVGELEVSGEEEELEEPAELEMEEEEELEELEEPAELEMEEEEELEELEEPAELEAQPSISSGITSEEEEVEEEVEEEKTSSEPAFGLTGPTVEKKVPPLGFTGQTKEEVEEDFEEEEETLMEESEVEIALEEPEPMEEAPPAVKGLSPKEVEEGEEESSDEFEAVSEVSQKEESSDEFEAVSEVSQKEESSDEIEAVSEVSQKEESSDEFEAGFEKGEEALVSPEDITTTSALADTVREEAVFADEEDKKPVPGSMTAKGKRPSKATPGSSSKIWKDVQRAGRLATVNYFDRIYPGESYPLKIRLSIQNHYVARQVQKADFWGESQQNPLGATFQLVPVIPGAICSPPQLEVSALSPSVRSEFWVTSFSTSNLDLAKMQIWYQGHLVDEMPLSIQATSQKGTVASLALGGLCLVAPLGASLFFPGLSSTLQGGIATYPYLSELVGHLGGLGRVSILASLIFFLLALIFYAMSYQRKKQKGHRFSLIRSLEDLAVRSSRPRPRASRKVHQKSSPKKTSAVDSTPTPTTSAASTTPPVQEPTPLKTSEPGAKSPASPPIPTATPKPISELVQEDTKSETDALATPGDEGEKVECGKDLDKFFEHAQKGDSASALAARENVTLSYTTEDGKFTKRVIALGEGAPLELLGEEMGVTYRSGEFKREWIEGLTNSLEDFEGSLKEVLRDQLNKENP